MPKNPDHPENLPESNADAIATNYIYENIDVDGADLISSLEFFLLHARQIALHGKNLEKFALKMECEENFNQDDFNGELQEGLYEPICLKWFLSRALKVLSNRLEFEVYESQQRVRPISKIIFNENGTIGSFNL